METKIFAEFIGIDGTLVRQEILVSGAMRTSLISKILA